MTEAGVKIHPSASYGSNAILLSIHNPKCTPEVIDVLKSLGANPLAKGYDGSSLFPIALCDIHSPEVIEKLIELGVDCHAENR